MQNNITANDNKNSPQKFKLVIFSALSLYSEIMGPINTFFYTGDYAS